MTPLPSHSSLLLRLVEEGDTFLCNVLGHLWTVAAMGSFQRDAELQEMSRQSATGPSLSAQRT